LSKLIASFEEEYVWLEVKSVSLIWKQKEGAGFQNWHIDLTKNGGTVYTICVNIGSLDIQADSGVINYLNAKNNAYAPDIDDDDKEAKEAYVGLHEVWNFLMTKPILTLSKIFLMTSFGRPFQESINEGISF
jgi:hypothetical protein